MTLEVEAPELRWEAGAFAADGGVVVRWGDRVLAATSIRGALTIDGELAHLHAVHGTLTDAGRLWSFEESDVEADAARFTGASVEETGACTGPALHAGSAAHPGSATRPFLTAEALTVDAAGEWTVTDVRVDPCVCGGPRPILSMTARSARVVPDRYVVLHGAAVRLFDVRVLPVPWWRMALAPEAFRLHLPEVSYGSPGWALGVQGGARLGGVEVAGGPAWRQDRGFRARVEGEATASSVADGGLKGELGWDTLDQRVRGLAAGSGRVSGGVARLGWDLQLASDRAYAEDFGASYVARGLDWQDSRLAGTASVIGATAWLPDDGSFGELAGVRARLPGGTLLDGRAGRLTLEPRLAAGVIGTGAFGGADRVEDRLTAAPAVLADVGGFGGGALGARGVAKLGPVQVQGRGEGGVILGAAGDAGEPGAVGWGGGDLRVEVPVWSQSGPVRAQWWPGARVVAEGAGEGWLPGDVYLPLTTSPRLGASDMHAVSALPGALGAPTPEPFAAGPSLRTTVTGGEVLASLDTAWLLAAEGARPRVDAAVEAPLGPGAIEVWGHGDAATASGEVGWRPDGDGLAPSVGMAHAPDVWLTWGAMDLRRGVLRAGASAAWDLGAGAWSGAGLRVGYDDGCVSGLLTADLSPDRALPDLGLQVRLRR